jgi:hypothetical protein
MNTTINDEMSTASIAPVGPLPPAGAPHSALSLDPNQKSIEIQKSPALTDSLNHLLTTCTPPHPASSTRDPASVSPPIHQSTNPSIQDQSSDAFPILTQALAYQLIEPARLNKFFTPFRKELAAGGVSFPDYDSTIPSPLEERDRERRPQSTFTGSYYDSISAALASPDQLPASLRNVLLTLEKAAVPDNANRLDDAIQRRIRTVNLYNRCAIDCALELWFRAPDELAQFAPPSALAAPKSDVGGSSSSTSSSLPSDAPRLVASKSDEDGSTLQRTDDSTVQRFNDLTAFTALARLSPTDYDRARRAEAKRLDLRIETLDAEVAKCRAELTHQSTPHSALRTLHSPEPWPEPVCGSDTLDQVSSRFSVYLVLPPGAADAMSLWTAHTHALAAFHLSPRLSLYSPKPGCGKTTAFDVLATMLPRPLRTENISPAVLFRLVDQYQPALLLDEVDAYLPQSEELRGLLNAGHKRGACAYRCEGEGKAVRAFRAFAPAALAGIGSLPATLRDRSVLVPLVQAEEGQIAARFDPLRTDIEKTLARKLARWAADNFDALAACDPPLPPGAFNRLADNWRPLLAVAQIAGGDWPARALDAFVKLTAAPRCHADNSDVTLVADIRQIFAQSGRDRLTSQELLDWLCALPGRTYSDASSLSRDPSKLARQLAPFGIRSRNLKVEGRCLRGYRLADFAERREEMKQGRGSTHGTTP